MTDLKGVEIFAAGIWNGDPYTVKDLDSIVDAYGLMPRRPPLKLGHSETQKFFGQSDGAPALGWVDKLYRNGKKLLADFTKVPDVVANFIRGGNYDRVSAEIYWNFKLPEGDTVLPRALKAVSLLGADMPAITSLQDLQTVLMAEGEAARVYDAWAGDATVKIYEVIDNDQGGKKMDEKQYTEQIATLTTAREAEKLRADKAEADLRVEKEGHAVREFTLRVGELKRAGKVLPAEEEGLIRAFRGMESGVKKFSDGEYDPRVEFVKSLEARPKVVEFKERAQGGEGEGDEKKDEITVTTLLRKYTQDGKLTEGQAFVKIKNEHPAVWEKYIKPGKEGK